MLETQEKQYQVVGNGRARVDGALKVTGRAMYADGQGIGGGVYSVGVFASDPSTVIRHNHASTSNNDLFA